MQGWAWIVVRNLGTPDESLVGRIFLAMPLIAVILAGGWMVWNHNKGPRQELKELDEFHGKWLRKEFPRSAGEVRSPWETQEAVVEIGGETSWLASCWRWLWCKRSW